MKMTLGNTSNSEGAMAFTTKQMSLIVATFGALSFIFGVIAENKKHPSGTRITGKGVVICTNPGETVCWEYRISCCGHGDQYHGMDKRSWL